MYFVYMFIIWSHIFILHTLICIGNLYVWSVLYNLSLSLYNIYIKIKKSFKALDFPNYFV